MKHNKLVRDKIQKIIASEGKNATYRILTDAEYKEALEKKLDEEVAEFHESKSIEELADILEVVETLCAVYGKRMQVHFEKVRKRFKRGGFRKKIFLIEAENETNEKEVIEVINEQSTMESDI